MKHLFYALLTILIVSSCTVDNPVNPEPQQPSYRDILAGGIKGTGH